MIQRLGRADAMALSAFAEIIDVRSPSEFADDHVPGAVNLPVLDDGERALVGTIYVQKSRFEARRVGASIVARNIADHLEGRLRDKPPAFAPLVYCWRGGQRSAAMATVLDQVGWRPTLLEGGYRTYRRAVNGLLSDKDLDLSVILLSGHTGTAKTSILAEVRGLGVQVLDLEGLAKHRGSLLGSLGGTCQPSQKMFESCLALEVAALDASRPVLIEAESSKIGSINIPEKLWKAMSSASMIEITAPLTERARYLVSTYRDIASDLDKLTSALNRLPGRHGRKRIESWVQLSRRGEHEDLALQLMEVHYDPAYSRWSRNHPRPHLAEIALDDLTPYSLKAAAGQIARILAEVKRR